MAKILLDQRHLIQEVATDQDLLLGHVPHSLVGKLASQLVGPLTIDADFFHAAFERACLRDQRSQFFCALYGRGGDPESFLITCEPHSHQPQDPICILLSLEPSQAIPLSAVFEPEEELLAWALLQTEWPYFVERVNTVFSAQFGFSEPDIVGQNLHRIKSPRVLSSGLRRLLHAASLGHCSHEILIVCTATGAEIEVDATCVPVVTPPSPVAEHLYVRFSAPRPLGPGVGGAESETV
jgi:hypothetical protein